MIIQATTRSPACVLWAGRGPLGRVLAEGLVAALALVAVYHIVAASGGAAAPIAGAIVPASSQPPPSYPLSRDGVRGHIDATSDTVCTPEAAPAPTVEYPASREGQRGYLSLN
jgi:hypothetical protein